MNVAILKSIVSKEMRPLYYFDLEKLADDLSKNFENTHRDVEILRSLKDSQAYVKHFTVDSTIHKGCLKCK